MAATEIIRATTSAALYAEPIVPGFSSSSSLLIAASLMPHYIACINNADSLRLNEISMSFLIAFDYTWP